MPHPHSHAAFCIARFFTRDRPSSAPLRGHRPTCGASLCPPAGAAPRQTGTFPSRYPFPATGRGFPRWGSAALRAGRLSGENSGRPKPLFLRKNTFCYFVKGLGTVNFRHISPRRGRFGGARRNSSVGARVFDRQNSSRGAGGQNRQFSSHFTAAGALWQDAAKFQRRCEGFRPSKTVTGQTPRLRSHPRCAAGSAPHRPAAAPRPAAS